MRKYNIHGTETLIKLVFFLIFMIHEGVHKVGNKHDFLDAVVIKDLRQWALDVKKDKMSS